MSETVLTKADLAVCILLVTRELNDIRKLLDTAQGYHLNSHIREFTNHIDRSERLARKLDMLREDAPA